MFARLASLVAAVAVAGACAGATPARRPPSAPLPPSEPPDQEPPLDEALEAKLEEMERIADWRSTVWASDAPNPPVPARARRVPSRGSFRASAVATIRAYHYRHSFTNGPMAEQGETSLELPFTKDGRLDGLVVPPEAELTADEQRRVLDLLAAADAKLAAMEKTGHVTTRGVLRCGFPAHHVLVFFDRAGAPVGKLFVCMTCGELQMLPAVRAMGGGEPAVMEPAERATLGEILDAHGLGAWIYDERSPTRQAVLAYAERRYGEPDALTPLGRERQARLRARPSGVPPQLEGSRASKKDRERLCTWFYAELLARARARHDGYAFGGFECNSGLVYAVPGEANACEAGPICDVPLGRVEACLRSSFVDGPERICREGPGPECDGLLGCLPGVRWTGRVR